MSFDDILKLALSELESMFGKPNHYYEVLPVGLHSGQPQVFFPEPDSIQVKISNECADNDISAYYQIAHESLHILAPVAHGKASVLEEGIAVWFSHRFLFRHTGVEWNSSGEMAYDNAWWYVNQLLAASETAIKDIWKNLGRFSPISPEDILAVAPTLKPELAQKLSASFAS